jgi:hypothetical protein
MVTTILIIAGTIAALVLSLIALCKLGSKDFYHRRRVEYVPHVWAFITASGSYWAFVSQDANALYTYGFTCMLLLVGCGASNPALEYMWAVGHHPNAR